MKPFFFLLSLVAISLLSSCYPVDPYQGTSIYGGSDYLSGFERPQNNQPGISHNGAATPKGYWDGDGVDGPAKIRINLADQRAYFFKGETLVGVSPISTGTDGHSTPRGRFKVTEKDDDHVSSLYGVIKDKATGQVLVKDADTRKHKAGPGEVFVHAPMINFMRFNGAIGMHAGFLPGYPASHGCVRMPERMAKTFFDNASYGTPVIVE